MFGNILHVLLVEIIIDLLVLLVETSRHPQKITLIMIIIKIVKYY